MPKGWLFESRQQYICRDNFAIPYAHKKVFAKMNLILEYETIHWYSHPYSRLFLTFDIFRLYDKYFLCIYSFRKAHTTTENEDQYVFY